MNKRKKISAILFFAFFIMSSSNLYAVDFNAGCFMYLHDNHQGGVYLIHWNAEVSFIGTAWNDQVSSLQVPNGCRLQVFQHWKFQGMSNTYPPGSYPAVGAQWNDQISSAKCICK